MQKTRFKCFCAYDGTDFRGWQSQACGNTIQDFIERRLAEIFSEKIRIHGSGRTDAGVHAKAQVFHFDAAWAHSAQNLLSALRCGLPAGIQIFRVARAKEGFHARYSAVGKRYVYNIYEGYAPPYKSRYCWSLGRRKLDVKKMNEAAAGLLGEHDFTAFSDFLDISFQYYFHLIQPPRNNLPIHQAVPSAHHQCCIWVSALQRLSYGRLRSYAP